MTIDVASRAGMRADPLLRQERQRVGKKDALHHATAVGRKLCGIRMSCGMKDRSHPELELPAMRGAVRNLRRQMDVALVWHGHHPFPHETAAIEGLIDWADGKGGKAVDCGDIAARLSTIENGYAALRRMLRGQWLGGVEILDAGKQACAAAAASEVVKAAVTVRSELRDAQRAHPWLR